MVACDRAPTGKVRFHYSGSYRGVYESTGDSDSPHSQLWSFLVPQSDKNAPTTEADRQAFARYVEKVVTRYKNDFTYWEVWNEPNILPFWTPEPNADDYAALLKITSETARKADPDCKLTAPTTAPLGTYDRKFIERLYQLGCKDYFDVFDYHYYRNHPPEDEVPAELADIKALMRRYGDDKPIWITETGVSSPIENKPESYEKQAGLVVRNQLLCLACGVERIFYFDLQNWTDAKDASWDSFPWTGRSERHSQTRFLRLQNPDPRSGPEESSRVAMGNWAKALKRFSFMIPKIMTTGWLSGHARNKKIPLLIFSANRKMSKLSFLMAIRKSALGKARQITKRRLPEFL